MRIDTRPSRRSVLLGLAGLATGCQRALADTADAGAPAPSSSGGNAKAPARDPSAERIAALKGARDKLRPLHERAGKPKPGDWLSDHPERGQSFEQYLAARPTLPAPGRRALVVLPLGEFPAAQKRLVGVVRDYMERYFRLPVRLADPVALDGVPKRARRKHPTWGDPQILTTWVLNELLPSRLPKDAAALLALTSSDLWPGMGWNFVFGQADLHSRVGVWSLYRHGDASASDSAFQLALRRAVGIAVHETGHMFSLEHCTAYRCVQAGVNSLEEADRSPLWACPECMVKIAWATGADPVERYRGLEDLCRAQKLDKEAAFFGRSVAALSG